MKSRKLWLAVIAALVVFANSFWDMGLKYEEVMMFISPLLLFIGVEGAADIKSR